MVFFPCLVWNTVSGWDMDISVSGSTVTRVIVLLKMVYITPGLIKIKQDLDTYMMFQLWVVL